MKDLIKKYIELEVKAIQNIPIDGIIDNVVSINKIHINCIASTRTLQL